MKKNNPRSPERIKARTSAFAASTLVIDLLSGHDRKLVAKAIAIIYGIPLASRAKGGDE